MYECFLVLTIYYRGDDTYTTTIELILWWRLALQEPLAQLDSCSQP